MRSAAHFLLFSVGLAGPQTQTSAAERDCVAKHAKGKTRAAEIGSWHGVSLRRIAEAIDENGTVIAVDPYVPGRLGVSFPMLVARRTTRKWRNRIRFMRTTGVDAATEFSRDGSLRFDFVFIDGDHSYDGLKGDWQAWSPLVAPDGVVALHDSRSSAYRNHERTGSCIYTGEIILKDPRFEVIEEVDSLTVLRRKTA